MRQNYEFIYTVSQKFECLCISGLFDAKEKNWFNGVRFNIKFYTKNCFLCSFFNSCLKFCW